MSCFWLTKDGNCIVKSGIDGIVPELYENFGQDLEIVKLEGQDDEYSKMVLWSNPGAKKVNFCSCQIVLDKKNNTYVVVSKQGCIDEDNEYETNTYSNLDDAEKKY